MGHESGLVCPQSKDIKIGVMDGISRTAALGGLPTPPSLSRSVYAFIRTHVSTTTAKQNEEKPHIHIQRPRREEKRVPLGRGAYVGQAFKIEEFACERRQLKHPVPLLQRTKAYQWAYPIT